MSELQKPLYSLTVGEYISLNQKIFRETLREIQQSKPVPEPHDDTPMTLPEAALFLKIARQTLYTKTSKREISFSKVGGKILFNKRTLLEYIEAHRKKSVEELHADAENNLIKHKRSK